MIKSKLKPKSSVLLSDYLWKDIILIGEINLQNEEEDNLIITDDTDACVFYDDKYYGIDLFQNISEDEEQFKDWQFKYKINGFEYLLLEINSIQDKYRIAYYNKNGI